MSAKLILVEGLAGSGKTTVAARLSAELSAQGIRTRLVDEPDPDYPFTIAFSPETLPAAYAGAWRGRWEDFAARVQSGREPVILSAGLYQRFVNPMAALDADPNWIAGEVRAVGGRIAPLPARLIHLVSADERGAFERTMDERGPEWTEASAAAILAYPFGKRRGGPWRAAALDFVAEVREQCDRLDRSLGLPALTVDNSARDWSGCREELLGFLRS